MKVDPIMLDRGVFNASQGEETISKNDSAHQGKNKWGFTSLSLWKKRERSTIGINPSSNVAVDKAAVVPAAATNAPKGILRTTPHPSCDSLVSLDRSDIRSLNDEDRSTVSSAKKVTWDASVKDAKKLSFVDMNKAAIQSVVEDLKGLAVGLDTNVQKLREKMQCGNMEVAKNFYCPNEGDDVVTRTCGTIADHVDSVSLGTNDIVNDDDDDRANHYNAPSVSMNNVKESREEEGMMLRGDDQQQAELREDFAEVRYEEPILEDRVKTGRDETPAPTTADIKITIQSKPKIDVGRKKKKKRGTLVHTNAASNYYSGAAPQVASPTANTATKIVQGATAKTVVVTAAPNKSKKVVVKAVPTKSPTLTFPPDKSDIISALTDPTTMPSKKSTKKTSNRIKHQEKPRRYTTVQPKQSKTGLKGKMVKPMKMMTIGLKSHLKSRKMLTFKANNK